MIAERHYDEDALVTMLDARALESDAHLATCGECAERLEDFRLVTECLRDAATWDQREVASAPNANTIATLRALADTMAAEDAAARGHLTELLAGPREMWMAKLSAHPEWRTAGMVRALIAATDRALDTMPADAVEITLLATDIAADLQPGTVSADAISRLRGAAWRERAYALYYTGAVAAADSACSEAEFYFDRLTLSEYEMGRLNVVRALISRSLENYRASIQFANEASSTFRAFGDGGRAASAQLAGIHAHFGSGNYQEALNKLVAVESTLQNSSDTQTHARVLGNLGFCCWKLGRIDEALRYHEAAAALFDDLGIHTESVRTRWNVAEILAGEGRVSEALSRLDAVQTEFQRLGMISAATLAGLDAAEILLANGDYQKVEEICAAAMKQFVSEGLEHTERALTALAFVKEAAASRVATPTVVRHVRQYLERLPDEPNLLFAPPPV